uniref:Uncharacterized protein n=1 Tax=Hyaloperonospora arabidopsidis (strain Emoy2) TaxID=559515 RepID=M4BFU8_HYAAE
MVEAIVDEVVEEVEVDATGGVLAPSDAKDDDVTAKLDMGPAEEKTKEPDVTLLGIFRGWHIDPITLNYKSMIYDDGDECMDSGTKYSMTVELIPSSNPESDSKLFGFKSAGICMFEASLLTYVPEEARVARLGIHTPGVIDITSAETVLPVICGKMKCRYEKIAKRVQDLSAQIRDVQDTLVEAASKANSLFTNMTLEASKNTLESAAQIVGKSVELFHEIEMLQQSLTNDWLGREEAAKREIAQQEAEDKKRKMEQNVSDANIAAAVTVEQEQVTAES